MIVIINAGPEHFAQLEELEKLCYPSLSADELLRTEHFACHHRLFPQGQHVALDGDRVVGMSATFRIDLDISRSDHSYVEIAGHGFFTNHNPTGAYVYGADMCIRPEFRRQGIASRLYDARKRLIHELGIRGMIVGGMLPGYRHYRGSIPVEEYVAKVARGELSDPTLTPQLRNGLMVCGVLREYLHDTELGNEASLLVWTAPDRVAM